MTAEIWFNDFAFYLVAAIILLSALGVILARRVMHAALCCACCRVYWELRRYTGCWADICSWRFRPWSTLAQLPS